MASTRKRSSRLGRGLSSLMAQPVSTTPAEEAAQAAHPGESGSTPAGEGATASGQPPAEPAAEPTVGATSAGHATAHPEDSTAAGPGGDSEAGDATALLQYIAIDQLRPNPHQPRQTFDQTGLQRLADSIRSDGLMQPIVVRPAEHAGARSDGPTYEIVAGERRWRAAELAELAQVPAIVRDLDDRALAEWALIENLQREDLNPIERAEAFQGLADRFGLGHDEIAQRIRLERSSISNLLRLLNLSDNVKRHVRDGTLSMGQARAIAGLPDADAQQRLADRAIKQGLSVRQVEQLARQTGNGKAGGGGEGASEPSRGQVRSAYLADLEQQIAEQLQTKVHIRPGRKKGSGKLTIEFYSLDQFDALLEKLGVKTE